MEYVHQPLDTEVTAVGGYYRLVKEARLSHRGREVLYLVGHAAFDTSCCGAGGCAYAIVPGYIIHWHSPPGTSQVEPVGSPADRDAIRRQLLASELVQQVIFM